MAHVNRLFKSKIFNTLDEEIVALEQDLLIAENREIELKKENEKLKDQLRNEARPHDEVWFEKGKLWFAHTCLGERSSQELDGWKVSSSGVASPSVHCLRCGAHFNATLQVSLYYHEGRSTALPWRPPTPSVWGGREQGNNVSSNWGSSNRDTGWYGDHGVEWGSGRAGGGTSGVQGSDGDRYLPRGGQDGR
jgi:uncharacterized protein YdcH (DUF465 family)